MKDIAIYVISAMVLFGVMLFARKTEWPEWVLFIINNLLILGFIYRIIKSDLPLSSLPVIGQKFRRRPG